MKLFPICIISLLAAYSATTTFGQYGLYGSPDTIKMSQQVPNMVPSNGLAAPSGGYTAPSSYAAQQPAQQYASQQPAQPYAVQQPTQQYAAQPVQSYTAQQMQPLPAKPVATYGQMGPQYRTPGYSRPMYYTAAADQATANPPVPAQQLMPAPTATPAPPAMPGPQMGASGQNPVMLSDPQATPGIQQNSGVMNQMLAEQGQSCAGGSEGYAPCGGQCGVYRPNDRFEQSACGNSLEGCAQPSLWYGSVTALIMNRDRPNKVYITYQTDYPPHNDYPQDELSWRWGGEVRLGRRFCSGCNPGYWALEATYWTLDNFQGYVSHTNPYDPYTVGTPLDTHWDEFWDRTFNPNPRYRNANDWFENASEHRLWRRDEVHNVEANLVRGQWCYGQDSPWDLGWSMGVRYFRFQESWRFGTLMNGAAWGQEGGAFEAYMSDNITNNLIGPQLGCELGYKMWGNMRFYMSPKFGIYNNNITNNFQAYLGNGEIARPTAASGMTAYSYPVNSSTNAISFLTQIDVGLDWKFAQQWSARLGYRVVAVSSIGLADAQIPFYTVDIPAIADIDKNGDLILHGAFVSLTYNF